MKPWQPTNLKHKIQCKISDCKHPSVYRFSQSCYVQGWCRHCRGIAFEFEDLFNNSTVILNKLYYRYSINNKFIYKLEKEVK
jgi:hypothetical protein